MSQLQFYIVNDSEGLRRIFPVISELRTSIDVLTFQERVNVQAKEGYFLVAAEDSAQIVGAAGFRILHCLALGRYMYIDDFVTVTTARNRGVGAALFTWLENRARENGCVAIQLDSGIQREVAQRFYSAMKMEMTCNHFTKML